MKLGHISPLLSLLYSFSSPSPLLFSPSLLFSSPLLLSPPPLPSSSPLLLSPPSLPPLFPFLFFPFLRSLFSLSPTDLYLPLPLPLPHHQATLINSFVRISSCLGHLTCSKPMSSLDLILPGWRCVCVCVSSRSVEGMSVKLRAHG